MKWQYPCQHERIDIRDLNLFPGEVLTVWMNRRKQHEERKAVQIELRVTPDGAVEIFTFPSEVRFMDFSKWTDEPKKPKEEV